MASIVIELSEMLRSSVTFGLIPIAWKRLDLLPLTVVAHYPTDV